MKTALISLLCTVGLLAGCATPNTAGEVYSRKDTLRAMDVSYGEVLVVVPVVIDGRATRLGLVGGGAIGYEIGREIGDGGGRQVAGAVGAVAGAVAGQAIEKKITEQDGQEITIEMDNGRVIAIVQAATVEFFEGERVRVLTGRGGHARVLKIR
ncbi:MAG: glycine zipper 2TM domain-containing protein [Gammaproteobacteria bacterium]|nr:glycine zipper 2TM domain-containing protein [Gammaproteobacteria bacterium]